MGAIARHGCFRVLEALQENPLEFATEVSGETCIGKS